MPKPITEDTITDEQIRTLISRGEIPSAIGKEALDRGALAFIADIRRAKRQCADAWNIYHKSE